MKLVWQVFSNMSTRSCQYSQKDMRRVLDREKCTISNIDTPKGLPQYWHVEHEIDNNTPMSDLKDLRDRITRSVKVLDKNINFKFKGVQR